MCIRDRYADSAIYVVKADGTPMPVAKRGVERLREKGINVTGAVISQVDLSKISSYGGDYYYQGYYDYYGYGESAKTTSAKRRAVRSISRSKDVSNSNNSLTAGLRSNESKRDAKRVSHLKDRRKKLDPVVDDIGA